MDSRPQNSAGFRELNLPEDYLKNLSEHSTDELLDIISRVTASMLRHLNLPEHEIAEFTEQVKERKMAELFENFKDVDIPAIRKKATEKGFKRGVKNGLKKGVKQGQFQGETRFASLIQTLMQSDRMDDLEKVLADPAYRKELYQQYNI